MSLGIREIGGGEIMHLFLPIYTPRAPSFFSQKSIMLFHPYYLSQPERFSYISRIDK